MIRVAIPSDFTEMIAIEIAAGENFRAIGMTRVADDPPPAIADLAAHEACWVATDDHDCAVGYLLLDVVDGAGHIEQVTVRPDHARRGIGAALIDAADAWARGNDLTAVTLTTFANVPWNAPYYSRLGFEVLPEAQWTAGLRSRVASEAANGLDLASRVVMRRTLGHPPG